MSLASFLREDALAVYAATEGLFGLVDDLDWKPATGTNWMTVGQLLHHCTNACGYCLNGFANGDWGLPEGEHIDDLPPEEMLPPAEKMPTVMSVAEAQDLLEADRALALEVLAGLDDARLLGERIVAPWGGPELTLFQQLNGMIWHLGQHKGQLFYYLKLQGKDVHTGHLWGVG